MGRRSRVARRELWVERLERRFLLADSFAVSIGIRETGTAAPIGGDGGTNGGIEWVNKDGLTLPADGEWHKFEFTFGTDAVLPLLGTGTSADGVLASPTGVPTRGTLEHIRILNASGTYRPIALYIDEIVNTTADGDHPITGFEGFSLGREVVFQHPGYSGSTDRFLSSSPDSDMVSAAAAHEGSQSYELKWAFGDSNPSSWLRLTTFNTPALPNPTVDFAAGNKLSFWMKANLEEPSVQWAADADGNWTASSNWSGTAPNGISANAYFLDIITAPRVVTLDEPVAINTVVLDASRSYTISGDDTLILNNPRSDLPAHLLTVAQRFSPNFVHSFNPA